MQAIESRRIAGRLFVVGICGAQGSGKTTLARHLLEILSSRQTGAATLSLDDLYLTRFERERLAREVHPLLLTRGPPGTHDVALGLELLSALGKGNAVSLPRFDKSQDDRLPAEFWDEAPAHCDVLLFEGWCVGARPQSEAELAKPVNTLEQEEDPEGVWRRFTNAALAGPYQEMFDRIDLLVLLAAPGFDAVFDWRMQQEEELARQAGRGAPGVMDAAAVSRFIQHYERLTRHILTEMPARARIVVRLGRDRSPLAIVRR